MGARLQRADLVILGSLNEGVWPALPSPDPWLAPRIRAELGLPGLERRIGLAAHDFVAGLGAPEVLVTRARRDVSKPTIASRLWLRLEAMTRSEEHTSELQSLMRISYAVFCLKKKKIDHTKNTVSVRESTLATYKTVHNIIE